MKSATSKPIPSNILNGSNSSGFSSQVDIGHERTATSVISRPPPGLLGYGTNPAFITPPVEFNDELLEERFEYYFYKRTRTSEFSWIGRSKCNIIEI